MAKIKKKVKKYIKKNEPTYKGLDKEQKKLVKARFEESVERYRKDLEAAKKKKRRSNNYDKIATAIGKMRASGINVTPPDINTSQYTFYPDVEHNQIIFGLRGMLL